MSETRSGRSRRKAAGSFPPAGTDRQDTRRAILDAAVELFLEHGYHMFSLRQVAAATGYTPTTIYLYFKDKDDLLFHVAMEGFRHFGDALQKAYASGATPVERLLSIGRAYIAFGLENPLHYRLMFMERGEFLQREPPPGFIAPINAYQILVSTIEECIEGGYFREGDPYVFAQATWATVHGIVSLALTSPEIDRSLIARIEEVACDMIVQGLSR